MGTKHEICHDLTPLNIEEVTARSVVNLVGCSQHKQL